MVRATTTLRMSCALVALAACLLACASPACAHGYLKQPASRNYRANLAGNEDCPHCYGSRNDNIPVCGGTTYMSPQSVTDTYSEGQEIGIAVTMTVLHKGRFEFRLCTNPNSPNWQCFDAPQNSLIRADNDHPGKKYWYLPTASVPGDFTLRYRLPSGITCDHCVLQWVYWTGNDCAPVPCDESDPNFRPGEPCGAGHTHLTTCTSRFDSELFLNCADIRIVPRSGGSTPTPTPAPTPTTTPVPSGLPTAVPGGQCGAGVAQCPGGYCCSQYGWCGVSNDHCSNGCQAGYGACGADGGGTPTPTPVPVPTLPVASPGGQCGSGVATCGSTCCSKWGWCGVTSGHCGSGCQPSYGNCW